MKPQGLLNSNPQRLMIPIRLSRFSGSNAEAHGEKMISLGFLLLIVFFLLPLYTRPSGGFQLVDIPIGLLILWIFMIWFASIYLIPEISRSYLSGYSQDLPSNEEINMKKLKTLMDFEAKAFEIIKKSKVYSDQTQEMFKKLAFEYRKN